MKKIYFIVFMVILYNLYKPTINLIRNPDIILSPGGLLGFYVLGICHYIKNHYNIDNKNIVGFSAGSLNTIFLSLDKSYDNPFLKDYTIGSMGPGDGKSYINIALSSKKDLNSQDLEYIVFFDRETFEVVDYEKT